MARGTLPVVLLDHRYEVAGVYTVRLEVGDGRASAQAEQRRRGHDAAGRPPLPPALTLSLSAPAVDLGTFIPGVARDYTAALTATTTGGGTLTVADRGANPGHLVGPAGALAQPLTVRGTSGAFARADRRGGRSRRRSSSGSRSAPTRSCGPAPTRRR